MKYRPEIDGLRALAVFPVILFHGGLDLFSGGFVGVDVFFVISGYLITTTLIEDIEKNRFSIVNFYERRARRILPALFFVMLVCIPFAWMWSFNEQYREFSQSLIAVSLFVSNIFFMKQNGYFHAAAEEAPLLHTWSLAVEEQYYLFFPIFLFFVWRFGKNRVFWIIIVFATISLLLSEWGWRNHKNANFYLAPTRVWELLAGSISAFIVQKKGVQKNDVLSLFGLAAIAFSIFAYNKTTPYPSFYTLVPVVGVMLLVHYANKETLAAKLLSIKAFVGIGLVSYSAYLWHQPLFAFSRWRIFGEEFSVLLCLMLILVTFALALVSYYFVETPIRKKKIFKTRNSLFLFSMGGLVLFVSVGLWGSFYYEIGSKKYPSYINSTSIPYKSYEPDNYFLINESWELQKEISGIPIFTVFNVEKDREMLFPMNSKKEKLLVVGNSHSVDFYNVLFFSNKIKKQFELARFGIQIQNINKEFYSTPNYKAADVIVLCSLMNMKDLKVLKEIIKKLNEDGKRVFVCQNIFSWMKRSNYTKLDRLVIKGALNGKNEISLSNEINSIYTDEYINRQFMTSERKKVFEYMEKLLIELLNELEFKILNRMDYVCNNQNCEIVSANVEKYFFDGGHHTLSGARHFGKRIDENGIADIIIAQ